MRAFSPCFRWLSLLATASGVAACGSNHDEVAKRLAAMQGELVRLQNHSDRLEERLEAVEMRNVTASARGAGDSRPNAATARAPLMVVKLEPGDDKRDAATDTPTAELRPEDSAADSSPRPVIRVHGSQSDGDVKMASDTGADNAPRKKQRSQ